MKYIKITTENVGTLKVGDVVIIYPNKGGIKDSFDENETDNYSKTRVEAIAFGNVSLSFELPKEGVPLGLYTATMGPLSRKLHDLYQVSRYWIEERKSANCQILK